MPTPPASVTRTLMNQSRFFGRSAASSSISVRLLPRKSCATVTFTLGLACAYGCSFCYVEAQVFRHPVATATRKAGLVFSDIVIRRKEAVASLREWLLTSRGSPKYHDPTDRRVIYSSPLVDVAANVELAKETVEACLTILELTHWQIRLLSKSTLLPYIAERIPAEHRHRMIFGVSTGTLDDGVARAIEGGTPLVSRRLGSFHQLQDAGFRTFGMICPSLHQAEDEYDDFSAAMAEAIRVDRTEAVWAEVINVRGESMKRTVCDLESAGFADVAERVKHVSAEDAAWERYARNTFAAHARHMPRGKLKFLQYVDRASLNWWMQRRGEGAIPLGAAVEGLDAAP